jgi:hypothetical protein
VQGQESGSGRSTGGGDCQFATMPALAGSRRVVFVGQPWIAQHLNKTDMQEAAEEEVLLGSFGPFDGHRMAENE